MKRYALPLLTLAAALALTACGGTNAAEGDKTACGLYEEAIDVFAGIEDRTAPGDAVLVQISEKLTQAGEAAEDLQLQDKLMLANNNIAKYQETQDSSMLDSFAHQTAGVAQACETAGVKITINKDLQPSK